MKRLIEPAGLERSKITCVPDYQKFMGGVDLVDQRISSFHVGYKTNKWTRRMFFQIIDMCANNSFIIYKQILKLGRKYGFGDFREKVFQALTAECKIVKVRKAPLRAGSVTDEVRLQNVRLHLPCKAVPQPGGRIRNRCPLCCQKNSRYGNDVCKRSKASFYCTQCKKHLSIEEEKNCFADWHCLTQPWYVRRGSPEENIDTGDNS